MLNRNLTFALGTSTLGLLLLAATHSAGDARAGQAPEGGCYQICAGAFPGECVYTYEPYYCVPSTPGWTVCEFEESEFCASQPEPGPD
jgi:hypothetical protein